MFLYRYTVQLLYIKIEIMKDKRVLYVSSEVMPYLPETEVSSTSFFAPKAVKDNKGEIRIFMPRYGKINERRHQLHEVIRLSGMNLVVNDMDVPLIIKVASIPRERMQVYFIDNDDYFKRKATYTDKDGSMFEDNDERAIFFAKGVIETIKKLNWAPDIIHVHGWLASLLPLYVREYYKNEPLFENSKIVTSVYNTGFEGTLSADMIDKLKFDELKDEKIKSFETPSYENMMKVAIENSDGVVLSSAEVSEELKSYIEKLELPVLKYVNPEELSAAYLDFYEGKIL